MADQAAMRKRESAVHHPVFYRLPRWHGVVPEGYLPNFLGVMTSTAFWAPYRSLASEYTPNRYVQTDYPAFDEEYFEWIDLLESVTAAHERFTMIELGAGWGRWIANAAAALRMLGNLPYTLIAVEAEPTHFQWMVQHLQRGDVRLDACRLIEAAVTREDGKVGFHTGDTPYGGPDNWYGQSVGGSTKVNSVSLATLLRPLDKVDLIDMDVQGLEFDVLESAASELHKVRRIHIETHNQDVERRLTSLFTQLGWQNLRAFPCDAVSDTPWGKVFFQGGIQTWLNPRWVEASNSSEQTFVLGCPPVSAPMQTMGPNREALLWNRGQRAQRPAISDNGFDMPGFMGHYYMWPEEYALLSKYVDLTQGDYLEIGSMCGIIAMSFAVKYPQRNFYCVDAFCAGHATIAGNKQAFLQNLRAHDLKNVTLIEEDSRTAVPKIDHRFDIALIDADHSYQYVMADALNSWPLLNPGGFIAFHDYGCAPETTQAVHDFLLQTGGCLVEAASCLAVVCKPVNPESRAEYAQSVRLDELQQQVADLQKQCATLRQQKDELAAVWTAVQQSASWRMLDKWRKVRERVAPPQSLRRRLYDSIVGAFRKH